MTVYIAGPMSGQAEYNRPAFYGAAKQLEDLGYTVLNPAMLPTTLKRTAYMPICTAMIDAADVVAMLPGWGKSAGATIERGYATYQGKRVVDYTWLAGVESEEWD